MDPTITTITLQYMRFMWSLFLIEHLNISSMWQNLKLKMNIEKIHVTMRLDCALKI